MQTTQLKTTELGTTGFEITRVGFGDGAIVGFRSLDQVDPLLDAANLELSDEDITTIEGDR